MEREISVGPDRPVKEDHLWRWTTLTRKFPPGPNRSIYVWTEISGHLGIMESTYILRTGVSRFGFEQHLDFIVTVVSKKKNGVSWRFTSIGWASRIYLSQGLCDSFHYIYYRDRSSENRQSDHWEWGTFRGWHDGHWWWVTSFLLPPRLFCEH